METIKPKQYLFNVTLFGKHWDQVPAILCFPTFFWYSVQSILNIYIMMNFGIFKLDEEKAFRSLIMGWFHILSPLISTIFRAAIGREGKYIDIVCPSELHEILWKASESYKTTKSPIPVELMTLEHYIPDVNGILEYRQLLNSINLTTNNVDNICDLIKYLTMEDYCPMVEECTWDNPPDSLHYTRFTTASYSKLRPQGPAEWGPYYWKIFHTIPNNPPHAISDNDEYTYMLDCFPSVLPIIVPCPSCQINYLHHIQPSTIPTPLTDYTQFYERIHSLVSNHKTIVE